MGGLTNGRDGNMHMGDMSAGIGIVSIISALARHRCPWAAGVALALQYRGTNGVAFSYFGDGSTRPAADWHEGVNMATVLKLPVVYLCNNNQYAYSTPLSGRWPRQCGGPRPGLTACRPKSSMAMNVLAVYEATGARRRPRARRPRALPARVQDLSA